MARLEQQPSASANAKTPTDSATQPDTVRPVRSGILPLAGVLAALAIAAGAFVYYQDESVPGTTATATTSDNTAAAPAATTPPGTEGASSTGQSAAAVPKTGADESANAMPTVHANAGRTHRVARAFKPTRAAEPRDRQVFLAIRPQPTYPLQALRAGEEGTVLVLAQVDVDGKVTDARVVHHSGSSILDRAAPNEVRRWKFEPALHDGRPVIASVEVPVNYRLNQ